MANIRVNGIELNYEVSGRGQPILFIHGLGSSGRDWEYQVDYFANQYQAVTYDVRGHGKSAKPRGPYSLPLFAADAAARRSACKTTNRGTPSTFSPPTRLFPGFRE